MITIYIYSKKAHHIPASSEPSIAGMKEGKRGTRKGHW